MWSLVVNLVVGDTAYTARNLVAAWVAHWAIDAGALLAAGLPA